MAGSKHRQTEVIGTVTAGRPSSFDKAKGDTICERLMAGESLRAICRDDNMPDISTVYRWLSQFEEFHAQYARAREVQADGFVDEIFDIADDAQNDWMERLGDDNQPEGWKFNGEHVQRSRLRVDSRKWFASKVLPKRWGDKIQQEISGPDGSPIQVQQQACPPLDREAWLKTYGDN